MISKVLKLTILLALSAVTISPVAALCIGCGCQMVYHTCLDTHYPPGSSNLFATCQNEANCCRDFRRICHGSGIRFGLIALSPQELDVVHLALTPFDSPEALELNRTAEMLKESVMSNNYEGRLLHSSVANVITPLLSSEEGRSVEDALADFEVPFTPWLDRDDPSGVGDFETLADFVAAGQACSYPVGIQCQTLDGIDWSATGETVTCREDLGLVCTNAEQPAGHVCSDYRVRFRC